MAVKVGHIWDPDMIKDLDPENTIGGYTFIQIDKGKDLPDLCILGSKMFNLSQANVSGVEITPMTLKVYIDHSINPHGVPEDRLVQNVYDLDSNVVYFQVSYAKHAWLFLTLLEALQFTNVIVGFKADGLAKKVGEISDGL